MTLSVISPCLSLCPSSFLLKQLQKSILFLHREEYVVNRSSNPRRVPLVYNIC